MVQKDQFESEAESNKSEQLLDILTFFCADKLYLLRSIELVLSLENSNRADLGVSQVKVEGAVLISQLEKLLKSPPVPNRSRDLNSQMISVLHLQHLRERMRLLQCILLYVQSHPLQKPEIEKLFKLSKKFFFLLNPSTAYLVDATVVSKLTESAAVLLQLILIKTLSSPAFMSSAINKDLLKSVSENLAVLFDTEVKILSPLQLAWAMVRFVHADQFLSDEDQIITERLATMAFDSGLWHITRTMIDMHHLSQSIAGDAAAATILSLVNTTLERFDAESAGGVLELTETIAACLSKDDVSENFWAKFEVADPDAHALPGIAGFMSTQIKMLPLDFEVTFKLLAASCSGKKPAEAVARVLGKVQFVTEQITGEETAEEIFDGENDQWQLRVPKQVACFDVPKGAVGSLYQFHFGAVVQWELEDKGSAWPMIEQLLNSPGYSSEVLAAGLRIYTRCRTEASGSTRPPCMKHILYRLFKTKLGRYSYDKDFNLMKKILHAVLSEDEGSLSESFSVFQSILPSHNGSKSSHWRQIFMDERESGKFDIVAVILDMMDHFASKSTELSLGQDDLLNSSIETVLTELFPSHLSWKYNSVSTRISISLRLLNIIKTCYDRPKLSVMAKMVRNLFQTDESMCKTMLLLCCVDSNELDESAASSVVFTELLAKQVSSSFYSMEHILKVAQQNDSSMIEEILTSKTSGAESIGCCVIKAVSGFIFNRSDRTLPFHAIRLLRRLCHFNSISLHATLGSHVYSLKSSILRKMEDEENFKYLQIPIVELLATIAEHQPSLLEIFLDLEDKDKESGEKKIGKQSCIPFVLDLIETSDENISCSEMESSFRFLHALWAGKKDSHKYFKVLRILRKREDFWESIFKPLYTNINESDALLRDHVTITVISHVMSIITYEFYYSTKIDDSFSKELKMLEDSKKMEEWVEIIQIAPIQLAELQNSKAFNDERDALLCLSESWRCFWLIFNNEEYFSNATKRQFFYSQIASGAELLPSLVSRIESGEDASSLQHVAALISSSCICTAKKCLVGFVNAKNIDMLLHSQKSLEALEEYATEPQIQNTVIDWLTLCTLFLRQISSDMDMQLISSLHSICTRLLQSNEDKLQVQAVLLVQQTFISSSVRHWRQVASKNYIMETMIELLCTVIKERQNFNLADIVVTFLVTVIEEEAICKHISDLAVMSRLILSSEKLYDPVSEQSSNEWPSLYKRLTVLNITMQNRLGPRFLSDNLDWVGVHQDRILYILGFAFKEPLAIESLKELMTVIMYLNGLAEHKDAWIEQVGQGGNSAAQTIQAVARIVIHIPKFFEHSKLTVRLAKEDQQDRCVQLLIKICALSFELMSKFSAPVNQIMLDEGLDAAKFQTILQPVMHQAPESKLPSYGAAMSCLSLGVGLLERCTKSTEDVNFKKQDVMYMIDQSLNLIMSQAAILFLKTDQKSRELGQFKNYLGSELEHCIVAVQRSCRSSWSSSPSSSPRRPLRRARSQTESKNDTEHGMLQLADQFRKDVLL
ncbi:unnamed protein product [Oikopleura dioica]|uniref:Uncharacterized protein n=1 Tax=Oikopleura dioica TaxID=34765 RepID=E4Y665_OIKDI|nr:unnamed protein product [Oikopleura dioica]